MKNELPYMPSWQNRFFSFIGKMPISNSIVFVLLFLVIAFLNHLVPWSEGKLPWGQVDLSQLNFHIWFLVILLNVSTAPDLDITFHSFAGTGGAAKLWSILGLVILVSALAFAATLFWFRRI